MESKSIHKNIIVGVHRKGFILKVNLFRKVELKTRGQKRDEKNSLIITSLIDVKIYQYISMQSFLHFLNINTFSNISLNFHINYT